jgi:hypothetical protein
MTNPVFYDVKRSGTLVLVEQSSLDNFLEARLILHCLSKRWFALRLNICSI